MARGIIPARAGFTSVTSSPWMTMRDHPRSRGVYRTWGSAVGAVAGSSPLARGLLRPAPSGDRRHRIIPARAGFTSQDERVSMMNADHPRSRGVYGLLLGLDAGAPGSSPLARGLPRQRADHAEPGGIIPARAGFTSAHRDWCPGQRGSSPLARGLPGAVGVAAVIDGIIPARAGFTRPRRVLS